MIFNMPTECIDLPRRQRRGSTRVHWPFRAALAALLLAALVLTFDSGGAQAAVDIRAGDIIVADIGGVGGGNFRGEILRIDPLTGFQTVVSSGDKLVDPLGIAVGLDGTIVVADLGADAVITIDPSSGAQTIFATGNHLINPIGVDIDAQGNYIVSDSVTRAVVRIDPITAAQTVVSSGGSLRAPAGVVVEASGDILVADNLSGIVRIDSVTGSQTLVTAGANSIKAAGIAFEQDGAVLVSDYTFGNQGVVRVNPLTGVQETVSEGGNLVNPFGLAVELDGSILVAEPGDIVNQPDGSEAIVRVNPATGEQTLVSAGGRFVNPHDLVIYPALVQVDGPASAPRKSRINLDVSIEHVTDVAGAQFELHYDTDAVRLVDANLDTAIDDDCFGAANEVDSGVLMAMACQTPQSGSFTAWKLEFRVTDSSPGVVSFAPAAVLLNDMQLPPQMLLAKAGAVHTIAITGGTCGDLDDSGQVNILDVLTLMQMVVELLTPTPFQSLAGDLDQNGSIGLQDAILLLQHVVGIIDSPSCGLNLKG
jgi:streptogramin lyase